MEDDSNTELTNAEVRAMLRAEGLEVSRSQIHYAVEMGKISPRRNGSNQYRFTREHVRRLAQLFQ